MYKQRHDLLLYVICIIGTTFLIQLIIFSKNLEQIVLSFIMSSVIVSALFVLFLFVRMPRRKFKRLFNRKQWTGSKYAYRGVFIALALISVLTAVNTNFNLELPIIYVGVAFTTSVMLPGDPAMLLEQQYINEIKKPSKKNRTKLLTYNSLEEIR